MYFDLPNFGRSFFYVMCQKVSAAENSQWDVIADDVCGIQEKDAPVTFRAERRKDGALSLYGQK